MLGARSQNVSKAIVSSTFAGSILPAELPGFAEPHRSPEELSQLQEDFTHRAWYSRPWASKHWGAVQIRGDFCHSVINED